MVRKQVEKLMAKPVTRREFLGYVGGMLLTVVGFTAVLNSVSETLTRQTSPKKLIAKEKNYYDTGRYGG